MNIISTTVGKNPLEEMVTVSKESEMQYLGAISKMTKWSLLVSKANHSVLKFTTISVIQVYAPTTNAKEAEVECIYDEWVKTF